MTSSGAASGKGGDAGQALAMRQGFQGVLDAIHSGSTSAFKASVKALGSKRAELKHLKDSYGRTMLHHAAQRGEMAICKELVEVLELSVNEQDNQGESPLALASATAQAEAVRYLLSQGAVPNLRQDPDGTAPLHRAANSNNKEVIDLLVSAGADVNLSSRTGTPLCWAAGAGLAENVEHLLKLGAAANPETGGRGGPLLLAAACGCEKAVQALLAAGAKVNQTGEGGSTALHALAAVDNSDEGTASSIASALLAAGADVNAKDEGGFTPLLVAAARRRTRLVELMLPASNAENSGLSGATWTVDGVVAAASAHMERLRAASSSGAASGSAPGEEAGMKVAVPEPEQPDEAAAADFKRQGDEAFVRKDNDAAEQHYSSSLRHATRNHVVWANRAMVYLKMNQPEKALHDARISRCLDPTYVKAWYREGAAFAALKRWEDAALAYFEASNLDPSNKEVAKAFQDAIAEGRKEALKAKS